MVKALLSWRRRTGGSLHRAGAGRAGERGAPTRTVARNDGNPGPPARPGHNYACGRLLRGSRMAHRQQVIGLAGTSLTTRSPLRGSPGLAPGSPASTARVSIHVVVLIGRNTTCSVASRVWKLTWRRWPDCRRGPKGARRGPGGALRGLSAGRRQGVGRRGQGGRPRLSAGAGGASQGRAGRESDGQCSNAIVYTQSSTSGAGHQSRSGVRRKPTRS